MDTGLRRIFVANFRNGGRLYGDYQNHPEQERLTWTIDGEPVCEIDLKASHPHVLAAAFGHPDRLPADPYDVISWVTTPTLRKAAKQLVACSINAPDGRVRRFPRGANGISFKEKHDIPRRAKVAELDTRKNPSI